MNELELVFPDGSKKAFPKGITGKEIAGSISKRLEKEALAISIDGRAIDLNAPIEQGGAIKILTFDDDEGKRIFWHSTAHIMAEAVTQLFPKVKVAIGPSIDDGFYYDFDRCKPFTTEDLEAIEKKMAEIISQGQTFVRNEISREEAIAGFESIGEDYKVELVRDIPEGETVSLYTSGEFTDLCRGPHIPDTSFVKAFKLLSVAGAYWRGSEKFKMLQRIYGVSFPKKSMLDEHLKKLEEAKARDHRKLGKELDLFSISDEIGAGLVLWHPNGAIVREIIESYWRKRHREEGYVPVFTPIVGKADLWETSGHLDFYTENMYPKMLFEEGDNYYVRPMNCPFHITIYKTQLRSYRDLPIRYCELGHDYRYERSGVLHGLLRVRGFTMDDAHIFCTPEQMLDEVIGVYEFALDILRSFGFENFSVYLSTRPDHFVGEAERWDKATIALKQALDKVGLPYKIDYGGGAFYGPKIDIKVRDALGREWQTTTIQFDFNEPDRFDVTYIDENGNKAKPYMVHRALLGSLERFFACLVEHYAGNFPVWLAPVQVMVLPVSENYADYAKEIQKRLFENGIRARFDVRPETIGYRIREAETKKIPYMLVVGEREKNNGTVSVRSHTRGDLGAMKFGDFLSKIVVESNPPNPEKLKKPT